MIFGAGGPNLYSPQWTFNAGAEYQFNLSTVSVTPRLNYAYVSGQFTSLTYSGVTDYLPAHGLLSSLVTFKFAEHWAVDLYGTNLTDKVYRTGQGLSNQNYYFYGPPRQYGGHVRYQF